MRLELSPDRNRLLPVARLRRLKANRRQEFDERHAVVRLIVRNQNAIARLPGFKRDNASDGHFIGDFPRIGGLYGDRKRKRRAAPDLALRADMPAEQPNETLADRQA